MENINVDNKKNVIWSVIGIGFNTIISLFFTIIIARINTTDDVGNFTYAFFLAVTLYGLGSFGGRVYQVTDTKGEFDDNDYVGFRVISSIVMIVLALAFIAVNRYYLYKSIIILLLVLFKFIESISDVYFGIMQKDNKLHHVGKSMTAKALIGIAGFCVVDLLTKNLVFAILSVVIVNLVVFMFYDLSIVKKIRKVVPNFKTEKMKVLFASCFNFCAFTFLCSFIINFPRYAIDKYGTTSMQAVFSYVIMPATVISLFGQFILQPVLVNLSNLYNEGDMQGFSKLIKKCIILLVGFTIICEIGAYILGIPVLSLVYSMDLTEYKGALLLTILGALFSTIASVLSVALTTMRVTKEQLILYVFATIFTIITSMVFVKQFGFIGGVLSYVAIMVFQFILYLGLYEVKKKQVIRYKESI